MTTPQDRDEHSLLLAEYALGVLDGDVRARVARQVQDDASLAAELAQWQQRLMPLTDDIASVRPAPVVWERIQADLGFSLPASTRVPLWNNVRFWRWLGLGASTGFAALATAAVALFVVPPPNAPKTAVGLLAWLHLSQPVPPSTPAAMPPSSMQGYRFATLVVSPEGGTGAVAWTATLDPAQARMIIAPAAVPHVADDRSAELWLVPAQGKPIALGLLTARGASVVMLSDKVMQALGESASLAVSIEPVGGSASGQPTGPIVAKGAINKV